MAEATRKPKAEMTEAKSIQKETPKASTHDAQAAGVLHLQRSVGNRAVQRVLGCFSHVVVFAELNLKLNLLWITIRPICGVRNEIADAVRARIPDARLVSHI